jgi:hypothetical protein
MHPDLEPLIEAAIADGVITDKERSILHKRAIALGVDVDELDMFMDARLFKRNEGKSADASLSLKEDLKKQDSGKKAASNCSGCGAPVNLARLTCGFCGALTGKVDTPEAELKAVQELTAALNSQLASIEFERVMNRKAAAFWNTAYTPNSGPALIKLAKQVIASIDVTATDEDGNRKLATRSRSLLRDAKMLGDPNLNPQINILEEDLVERMDEYKASVKKDNRGWILFAVGLALAWWLLIKFGFQSS